MTKYVYQGEDLYRIISKLRDIILTSSYNQYMREASCDRHQISRQFSTVLNMLKDNKDTYYDEDDSSNALLLKWRQHLMNARSMTKDSRINIYNQLWNKTETLLHEISSGFKIGFNDSEEIVRKRAEEDVNADIQSLDKIRNEILTQIDQEKSKGDKADQTLLSTLEKSFPS